MILSNKPTDEQESILALIEHINSLGRNSWWEVVYYSDGEWKSFGCSDTFQDGERVIKWEYCKRILPENL
jgi:hypothetical protein